MHKKRTLTLHTQQPTEKHQLMLHSTLLAQIDEVARRGSIRAAADVLNVSASSINRRIIQLEEEIGTPLFIRHSGGMKVTAAGEVVPSFVRSFHSYLWPPEPLGALWPCCFVPALKVPPL